ncbi:MAG TPA: nitroreductase/quinone reductase family protein [Thermoleophilaceae bacterium]|jgi:deazaflavin-dependent oxidoreductase (nitroreductase family)
MASERKHKLSTFVSTKLFNPGVRFMLDRGIAPKSVALLETTGRKSGEPRRTPVGNGLRDGHFWIVTEHGRRAAYVKNIEADPRVRVKVGRRWYSGTAHVLPDDDPLERMRILGRAANDSMVRLMGTEHLTIRIDLDAS